MSVTKRIKEAIKAKDPLLEFHKLRIDLLDEHNFVKGNKILFNALKKEKVKAQIKQWTEHQEQVFNRLMDHLDGFERFNEGTEDIVKTLKGEGLSKVEIYEVCSEFHLYLQVIGVSDGELVGIEDVLDGLWGGGWDKGNRILPDEPDVYEYFEKKRQK